MKIFIGADHGGYRAKEFLKPILESLGHEVVDVGAHALDIEDDYPDFIMPVAREVARGGGDTRGIVIGGSGQGEAFAANRVNGVRAVVYYGEPRRPQIDADGKSLDMLESTRSHNDANILSLGARFLTDEEMKQAVTRWLSLPFSDAPRHVRRIQKTDKV